MRAIFNSPGISIQRGELLLGDKTLTQLAMRAGQTPFYVYLRSNLTEKMAILRAHLPPNTLVYYSMKANPMPALVQHMSGLVDGLDVASIRELRIALDTGIAPSSCLFTGPGKTQNELRAAVASGVVVNLESAEQMRLTAQIGRELNQRPKVMLRLHPPVAPARTNMKSYRVTQFGIDVTEVPSILKEMDSLKLDFEGFHVFWGSQFTDATAICNAQCDAYDLAMRLAKETSRAPKLINVGGGFAAPFFDEEPSVSLQAIREGMQTWMENRSVAKNGSSVAIELGRYLVADAGFYVCQVVDRKTIGGETFLITDGGLHQHMAASGSFGQLRRRNYTVLIGNRLEEDDGERVSITGRLCSGLDRIADAVFLPKAQIGDYVVVFNSGAYGPTFSPGGFLGHPPVVEILV